MLQLRIYLTPQAFVTVAHADDEESQDDSIKERKLALLYLLKQLGRRELDQAMLAGLKEDAVSPSQEEPDEEEQKEIEGDQVEILYEKARGFEDVPEMEPTAGVVVDLRGYQKQALSWMSSKENLANNPDAHSIHPLWEEHTFPSDGSPGSGGDKFYLNPYTGEMTLQFPSAADRTRGGILADEMGLGKTLETLALIHTNRPTADDMAKSSADVYTFNRMLNAPTSTPSIPQTRATLIVCPVSLLSQWRDEVTNRFTPGSLTCGVYYGQERTLTISDLVGRKAPDVVITTYGVVSSEWGDGGRKNNKASLIFGVEWFRVVLDEAHWIKNKQTATAKSCFKIEAKRRWAVTGTPIQNKLEDLFSLVHFLRIEPWANYAFWRQFISVPFANKDSKALNVVQSILEPIVLRRQKSTPSGPDGRPIVELPSKTVEIELLDFTQEERDIYTALWTNSKTQFSAFCAAGSVLSHWAHVFQMLTRLRQCCLHPELALGKGSSSGVGGADVDQLIRRFQNGLDGDSNSGSESPYMDIVIQKLTQTMNGGENQQSVANDDDSCPICFDLMAQPTLFPCLHISCWDCIVGYLQKREQNGEKGECPICRKEFREEDLLDIVKAPAQVSTVQATGATSDKENGTNGSTPASLPPSIRLRRHFHSSTKLTALISHLKHLRETDPDVKTVVFSQFTSMLSLCEIVLEEHGFGFARLDGTMTQKERENTLKRFASDDDEGSKVKVLLASMRTAGVGLNLVRASFVVIMEPWWNAPVESQTIDRVHRIGQTRPVLVKRFVMRDSVEERMLSIQERKTVLCKWAIREGETGGVVNAAKNKEEEKRNRVEELKTLFG
ncbi:SNF2 family N-terminal domain-containing protein [Powellomyces hirtus]|nr:SNF2 family N-terminal domain-containing protein [Powellomyces hirtus]